MNIRERFMQFVSDFCFEFRWFFDKENENSPSSHFQRWIKRHIVDDWPFGGLMAVAFVLMMANGAWAYTDTEIVNAIYKAEGGAKAQYAYGIRSVKYSDINEARRICFNTVRNNRVRFAKQNKYSDYIEFLGSRYCPVSAHKLNQYWISNVKYFLTKKEK